MDWDSKNDVNYFGIHVERRIWKLSDETKIVDIWTCLSIFYTSVPLLLNKLFY